MPDTSKYTDKRSVFWSSHVERAHEYDAYLETDPDKAARWRDMDERIPELRDDQRDRLRGYDRRMHVLIYSGIWCGDCVRQGPMLRRIAEACGDGVSLRVIERDASAELVEELRVVGAMRVPIVVFLSEDFWEVGRFGDRMLSVYRAKASREVGAACDAGILPPPPDELAAELSEWVDIFERMLLMLRLSPPLRERYGD